MKRIFTTLFLLAFSLHLYAQTDTTPPSIAFQDGISVEIVYPCNLTIFANELVDTLHTDLEGFTVQLGIRKKCTGEGFPEGKYSINLAGNDIGYVAVELWARDTAGNTAKSEGHILLQSNFGGCESASPTVLVVTRTNQGVGHVQINTEGIGCQMDTTRMVGETILFSTSNLGLWYAFPIFTGNTTTITPSKKINPTNGVTTYDLVLIQKHILGITPLDSPYKLIAADANMDGAVTGADVILLRKLLLGIIQELPHGQSWRFVPLEYEFPNQANPFVPPFPEQYVSPVTEDPKHSFVHFIGVKIGDVNYTAFPEN